MACKYVKDFDFTPYKAGGHVKPQPKQDGHVVKKASGGALVGPPTAVAPGHVAAKKGGKVSEAKIGKVMTEFKEGKLHSGSKKGPEVTNPKQAIAIAISESRKAAKKK